MWPRGHVAAWSCGRMVMWACHPDDDMTAFQSDERIAMGRCIDGVVSILPLVAVILPLIRTS